LKGTGPFKAGRDASLLVRHQLHQTRSPPKKIVLPNDGPLFISLGRNNSAKLTPRLGVLDKNYGLVPDSNRQRPTAVVQWTSWPVVEFASSGVITSSLASPSNRTEPVVEQNSREGSATVTDASDQVHQSIRIE